MRTREARNACRDGPVNRSRSAWTRDLRDNSAVLIRNSNWLLRWLCHGHSNRRFICNPWHRTATLGFSSKHSRAVAACRSSDAGCIARAYALDHNRALAVGASVISTKPWLSIDRGARSLRRVPFVLRQWMGYVLCRSTREAFRDKSAWICPKSTWTLSTAGRSPSESTKCPARLFRSSRVLFTRRFIGGSVLAAAGCGRRPNS